MKQPFSVLMSVYLKSDTGQLEEAIKSIHEQTLLPDQFVIVIDGEVNQETEALINKWVDKWPIISIVRIPVNKGLGNALSEGLRNCKFEFIARMDSDDIASIHRFEKQFSFIENNPEVDIVGAWIAEFEKNVTNIIQIRETPLDNNKVSKFARFRDPMNHMTVIFKKSKVFNCGGYLSFYLNEDYFLWLRMIQKGYVFANIPEPLVYVRTDNGLYARRGGFKYLINEIKLENFKLKIRIINIFEYLFNCLVRIIVRFSGSFFRKMFYYYFLRKSK